MGESLGWTFLGFASDEDDGGLRTIVDWEVLVCIPSEGGNCDEISGIAVLDCVRPLCGCKIGTRGLEALTEAENSSSRD